MTVKVLKKKNNMAFKMKKFSGFGNSPMKQDKKFKATFEQKKKKEEKKKKTDFPKHAEKPIGKESDYFQNFPMMENTPKPLPGKPGNNFKKNLKYMKPVLGDSKKIKNIKSKIKPF
jgi:hypothetical protein